MAYLRQPLGSPLSALRAERLTYQAIMRIQDSHMYLGPRSRVVPTLVLVALITAMGLLFAAIPFAISGTRTPLIIAVAVAFLGAVAVISGILAFGPTFGVVQHLWELSNKLAVIVIASVVITVLLATSIAAVHGASTTVLVPTHTPRWSVTNSPATSPAQSLGSSPTNTPISLPTNTPISLPTNTPISLPTNTPISLPTNTPIIPTATTVDVAAYQTAVPGKGCDPGGARWQEAGGAQISCTPSAMELQRVPNTGLVTEVFLGNGGSFPTDYNVAVTISNVGAQACPGIVYRGSTQGFYVAVICDGGICQILRYDATGIVVVTSTSVATAASYRMSIALSGSHHSIAVNGAVVISVDDGTYPTTHTIGLSGYIYSNSSIIADFSDFAFVPLS